MKTLVLIFILALFIENKSMARDITKVKQVDYKADTLTTPQLIAFLQQINVDSFYGKPVDSFLLSIDAIPYNMKVYGGDHSQGAMLRASYLWYNYSGGPIVRIYVREYTHMSRYSPTATWDVNLFRQEKIYKIEIYKDQNTRIICCVQ